MNDTCTMIREHDLTFHSSMPFRQFNIAWAHIIILLKSYNEIIIIDILNVIWWFHTFWSITMPHRGYYAPYKQIHECIWYLIVLSSALLNRNFKTRYFHSRFTLWGAQIFIDAASIIAGIIIFTYTHFSAFTGAQRHCRLLAPAMIDAAFIISSRQPWCQNAHMHVSLPCTLALKIWRSRSIIAFPY